MSGSSKNAQREQIFKLREIFRSFDQDKDGRLTHLELTSLIRSFGIKPTQDQLEYFIEKADSNENGTVEFKDMVALVVPDYVVVSDDTAPYTEEQLWRLFRVFDRDEDGFVSDEDLMHTMEMLGHELTMEELDALMEEADTDGDGVIDFQEFSIAMISAAFQNSDWELNK